MKSFKGNWSRHDRSDQQIDSFERRARKNKRTKRSNDDEEEMEYQSWMNRPADVDSYLDAEDFQSYSR